MPVVRSNILQHFVKDKIRGGIVWLSSEHLIYQWSLKKARLYTPWCILICVSSHSLYFVCFGLKPIILIVINKKWKLQSRFYSDVTRLPGCVFWASELLRPLLNQPACGDLRKGFVPSGPPAVALVLLFLLPFSLDGRHSDKGRFPLFFFSGLGWLFKSLLLPLVLISFPEMQQLQESGMI